MLLKWVTLLVTRNVDVTRSIFMASKLCSAMCLFFIGDLSPEECEL